MSCRRFCYYREQRSTEDESEWSTPALEIFIRAHRLLKSFMEFYRFHAGKCCGINYDAVPLHGALDIVATAMTSIICGNVAKKGQQRPGMFRDAYHCVRCQETAVFPEEIIQKVDVILTCLQRCCDIEDIICHIKSVLCILERLAACGMSEKLRTLSLLLKEIMKTLICSCERLDEPFANTQAKLTLNLANNYIRDWSEKRTRTRPCLKMCRFCDRVVSEASRQWGTFCCNKAQQFHDIRTEWFLRQSISDATRDESIDWRAKSTSPRRDERFDNDLRTHVTADVSHAVGATDYEGSEARFDDDEAARGTLASADRTTVHRSGREISETRRAEAGAFFPRKTEVERYGESGRETDKFDRVVGRDLTKTAAVARAPADGGTRGKIKRSRDIDRTGEYPITPDGREERDDVPYKSKLDKIRGSRGLRDANDERAGETREIKRDVKYSRLIEHAGLSKTKPEDVAGNRTKERKGITSTTTERSPNREMTITENKGRKLYRNRLEENVPAEHDETTIDTNIEEKISGRGRKKKLREEEDEEEMDELADINESKVAGRQKRKKKADAFDSGRKVSYRFDEEGKVLNRDGKRKSRSSKERDETESDLTKKHRNVKRGISSGEDKSTLDSERKMERRLGSNGTGDDHSKTNGSRYSKKKMAPGKFNDAQIDDRSPIEYQLSNEHFVRLGWTVLPVAKIMRKIIQYQAKPAKPHLDWFKKHKLDGRMYYDDGSRTFVNFHTDRSAEVFYPNGVVAIKLQRPQNRKYDMYTVFSPGGKDCVGVERGSKIVAVFDTMGNGAVLDEDGATRLSYNQIGGIYWDNPTGVPLTWKWDICQGQGSIIKTAYTEKRAAHLERLLNQPTSPSILKQFSSGSVQASSSPASSRNKEKKVAELKPVVQEHDDDDDEEEVVSGNYLDDTYYFKPIHLMINVYVSLKIINRRNITLQFSGNRKTIRIELGTILNLNEKVGSYFVDTSLKYEMLKCKFENLLPSRLSLDSSMHDIAEKLQKVRKSARQREFMMAKYRPFLRAWKMSGTRCRPR
ncbi:hypothetical protein QLX08_011160 [Tetragonisca angustula]|uniref:FAM194 C-terminal domain-containing protein n=1 Tax=Tetragonisca angustula TaxID=166442 RepID=A0AAW0ZAJ3_9HYME